MSITVFRLLCVIAILNVTLASNEQIQSSYLNVLMKAQRLFLSKPEAAESFKIPSAFLRRLSGVYLLDTVEDVLNSRVLQDTADAQSVSSATCLNHTVLFLEGILQQQQWAIAMADAAGKPGSWLLGGEVNWVGSYQECNRVVAEVNVTDANNKTEVTHPFSGQYCTAVVPLKPSDARPPIPGTATGGVRIGLCFPDTCTGPDVTLILNSILVSFNTSIRVFPTICQEKTLEYDTKAIVVLCVISLIVLVMIMGTAYDIVHIQMPRWAIKEQTSVMSVADGVQSPAKVDLYEAGENTPLIHADDKPYTAGYQPGRLGKALLAFSVYTNAKKILNTKQSKDSITCIHGIRFVSMTWVILGHTLVFGMTVAKNYATFAADVVQDWTFQAIINATVSVDTFFAISGLLVTYLVLKQMKKSGGKINWFMFYFHRFWRLTPVYMLVIMVYVPLFRYWGEGPQWPQNGIDYPNCDYWWTNLLYINNLVKPSRMCMAWSWYLSNDMQFYILSPLIFVPFFYNAIFGCVSLSVFLLATFITSGVLSNVNKYPIGGLEEQVMFTFFPDFYVKPYTRMGPYLVGIATGYVLYKTQCKVKISKSINIIGWMMATATALAVIYGVQDVYRGHPVSTDVAAFYNTMARTAWAASVCWVVFSCATGNGGVVNSLLSWSAIMPFSRLTYCAYLVHPILIDFRVFNGQQLINFTYVEMAFMFMSYLVASYSVAFVISLAFEAPMMGLEKVFWKKSST